MSEHQALFVEEASELFNNAYDILLPAEEADALETEAIDELFRIIHTLKGSSGGVEFDYLCRYTHALEDLLEKLREGTVAYQSGMVSFFVDALDGMQDILAKEMKGHIDTGEFEKNLKKLEQKAADYKEGAGESAPEDDEADEGFVLFDAADFDEADEAEDLAGEGSEDEGFVLDRKSVV